jgi:pyruvate,water dikinase
VDIKELKIINLNEMDSYGGKAANLGYLIQQGFKVPYGVALSMKCADDYDMEVLKDFLETGTLYSVRSSAAMEDGTSFSFAGQFDTVLGVKIKDIPEAIDQVYESQLNARVSGYMAQSTAERFGVIIQKMVPADISGVMFTANPIDSNRKTLVIESTYGLGEAIVSGRVNTDKYIIEKETLEILNVSASLKENCQRLRGEELIEDFFKDEEPSLKYEQVLEVARLGVAIEDVYDVPQDIEFALVNNEVFILQSRPITTLWPEISKLPEDRLLICFNAIQMMMDPLSPLGSDVLVEFAQLGRGPILYDVNGYLYSNIHGLISNRFLKKFLTKLLKSVDEEASEIIKAHTFNKNPLGYDLKVLFTTMGFLIPKVLRARMLLRKRNHDQVVAEVTEYAKNFKVPLQTVMDKESDDLKKIMVGHAHLQAKIKMLFNDLMPPLMGAMMMRVKLEKRYGKEILSIVEKGLENNLTSKMGLLLEEMGDYLIKEYPGLKTSDQIEDILQSDEGYKTLHQSFMEQYGFRGTGEIDIAAKRYIDQPQLIHEILLNQYQAGESGRIKALSVKQREEAESYETQGVRTYRALIALREHPKYAMMGYFYTLKKVYITLAEKWVIEGRLESSEDIFMLHKAEILEELDDYTVLVKERKQAYERNKKLSPPKMMKASGRRLMYRRPVEEGTLLGTPASSGIIKAQVRIVENFSDAKDISGKILVTRFTDPGWTPVFNQIAGLITEVGGLMTHGSVVAREYGIPAVVGVAGAMEALEDGAWVILNGEMGTIKIVS